MGKQLADQAYSICIRPERQLLPRLSSHLVLNFYEKISTFVTKRKCYLESFKYFAGSNYSMISAKKGLDLK